MKKRWKPKYLEKYYTIYYYNITDRVADELVWCNDDIDKKIYRNNLCFKTKPEAQTALRKLKRFIKEKL